MSTIYFFFPQRTFQPLKYPSLTSLIFPLNVDILLCHAIILALISTLAGPLLVLLLREAIPPFLITIPLKGLLLAGDGHALIPCPSLFYLEDSSPRLLSPLPLLLSWRRVPEVLIGPHLLPLGGGLEGPGATEQNPPLPLFLLTFSPMKFLVLNYSHPTLIVID